MNYAETIEYLFACAPMFQQVGAGAYKAGLQTSHALDEHLGHPHRQFKSIHVGGTNGKGSTSHTLAAILQASGQFQNVGLYTSPHLIDFRERFRVNGEPMSEAFVVDFVAKHRDFFEPLSPSFFELTTAMGFAYFATMGVDIAVIEVGLGGRLDCTNIISPILSIITNISKDHTQFLGSTLEQIATEKAGIIKPHVPIIIGEHGVADSIFAQVAHTQQSPLLWAEDEGEILDVHYDSTHETLRYNTKHYGSIVGQLTGLYQQKNATTVLTAVRVLQGMGIDLPVDAVRTGFAQVCDLTHLHGRWQTLRQKPRVICDTGHNVAGITWSMQQLQTCAVKHGQLRLVFGMVDDKDVQSVLPLLPRSATYYWCTATTKRAIDSNQLQSHGQKHELLGKAYPTVAEAYAQALSEANEEDLIFVGGSSYVVADLLLYLQQSKII